jgi:hypothetical protein
MPRLSQPPAERDRRAKLWAALHAFVRNHGGWITTQPNALPARMEALPDSELPELLRAKGWLVTDGGQSDVFLPEKAEITLAGGRTPSKITTDRLVATTVSLWQIDLPS